MATKTNVSPAEVQKTLEGVAYPADKHALITYAQKKNVDIGVIQTLDGLPDREYVNSTDVSSELSNDSSISDDTSEDMKSDDAMTI